MFDLISRHPAAYGALLAIATFATLLLCGFATAGLIPTPCVTTASVITVVCWMTAIAAAAVRAHRRNTDAARDDARRQVDAYRIAVNQKLDQMQQNILAAVGAFADQHIDAIVATARHNVTELHNELRNGRH